VEIPEALKGASCPSVRDGVFQKGNYSGSSYLLWIGSYVLLLISKCVFVPIPRREKPDFLLKTHFAHKGHLPYWLTVSV
jgi:hypothetical protein